MQPPKLFMTLNMLCTVQDQFKSNIQVEHRSSGKYKQVGVNIH